MTMTVTIAGDTFVLQFYSIKEACEFLQSYAKNNDKDINMLYGWEDDDDDN